MTDFWPMGCDFWVEVMCATFWFGPLKLPMYHLSFPLPTFSSGDKPGVISGAKH